MWVELINPSLQASVSASLGALCPDVEAAEEACTAAAYEAIKARIAQDEQAYVTYCLELVKHKSRAHIQSVQHHKTQNAKGLGSGAKLLTEGTSSRQTLEHRARGPVFPTRRAAINTSLCHQHFLCFCAQVCHAVHAQHGKCCSRG